MQLFNHSPFYKFYMYHAQDPSFLASWQGLDEKMKRLDVAATRVDYDSEYDSPPPPGFDEGMMAYWQALDERCERLEKGLPVRCELVAWWAEGF